MEEIVIAQRYIGREVLGEGSVARTLKAVDQQTGAMVAVKVLYPSRMASTREFERFEEEAAALQRLNHAAIPRYIDHFPWEEQGSPVYCLVQEFREGRALEDVLAEGKRFTEAETIAFARQILMVLRYLGDQDPPLVHRDLKPANLVLDARGDLSLVDFGAVREAVRQTLRAGCPDDPDDPSKNAPFIG